jgi:hypothetical protein
MIFSDVLLRRVEDHWHEMRLPNRAEAIHQPLEKSLKLYDYEPFRSLGARIEGRRRGCLALVSRRLTGAVDS